jgi:penicillin-binding protein 2
MSVKDINQQRQIVIIGVFIIAATILLGRAAQLQLLSSAYRLRADAISIEKNILYPSRGVVYDRNNNLMVYNNAMYDLMATYKMVDKKMDTAKFCRLLDIDTATFRLNLDKDWSTGKYHKSLPYPFLTMIMPEHYARFQESLIEFPGFERQIRNVRGYPQHNGGHVLGYLSEVNEKILKDSAGIYEPGDYIGTTGLEKYYESLLRGKKGVEFIMKDNLGRRVGAWKEGKLDSQAVQGKDLLCTVDLKLQALGEKLMEHKIGSIVAIEPKTGEILAMVTSPTFDPTNMVISKKRGDFIASMYRDSLNPLFDRSVSAKYPPGSIYKPVLAAIALQMGVWDKNNGVTCNGGYYYDGKRLTGCHHRGAVGNLSQGIEHSCNDYFCTVYRSIIDRFGFRSARIGLDSLNEYLYRFGLGHRLELDFPAEKAGFIPTPKFYDKLYRRDKVWYSTNFVSNGIGQGENQLTTIQMANIAATVANRGWFITPHLIRGYKDTSDPKGYRAIYERFVNKRSTGVDALNFDPIIRGMIRVIEGGGTGNNAHVPGIEIAGKTGTVENPHGDDSSVFIGFAPADDPKIAVAVYVENAKWGNDVAAPITGLMIEHFLRREVSKSRQYLIDKLNRSRLAYSSGRGYYVTTGY